MIDEVLELSRDKPELLQPLTDAPSYLQVEIVYSAMAEGALHLEDILARRTRIAIEYAHRGSNCAEQVAQLVAPILGWDAEDIEREVELYYARVKAEIKSQAKPDDESADALRAAAPESRRQILEPVPIGR
jgi:glycerol-3-phosphate dehydrogenase